MTKCDNCEHLKVLSLGRYKCMFSGLVMKNGHEMETVLCSKEAKEPWPRCENCKYLKIINGLFVCIKHKQVFRKGHGMETSSKAWGCK